MYYVTVFLISGFLLTAIATGATKAETQCNPVGWFGKNCQYQCHCARSTICNQNNGFCSAGCQRGWFGPACQYASMDFTAVGGPGEDMRWLTDMDENICATEKRKKPLTLHLNISIPLTWIRVVVKHDANLNDIQLKYKEMKNNTAGSCRSLGKAKVDDRTYDLVCETGAAVNQLYFEGTSVDNLCSIFVSRGRNVALKQTARQSSTLNNNGWQASNAVDGKLDIPDNDLSQAATCTHTRSKTQNSPQNFRGSWNVTFYPYVDVLMMLIHNRRNPKRRKCCERRLENFELTVTTRSNAKTTTPFQHIDNHSTPQDVYPVIPPTMITNVTAVNIQAGKRQTKGVLTLCEVEIYGEIRCPTGKFGLSCDRQCNCLDKTNCFFHSGGCPAGCAPGYTGEDCQQCTSNKYGARCEETCSEHCVKKRGNICDRVDGTCVHGCYSGYYGYKCAQKCSAACGGDFSCDRNSGNCLKGCKAGYTGEKCKAECTYNKYGAGCKEACSDHCVWKRGKKCDPVYGNCVHGCDPGYYGPKCDKKCSTTCGGNGFCDRNSGNCSQRCKPGYIGKKCNAKCTSNKYGAGCRETCSKHCRKGGTLCDPVYGSCNHGCDPRYYGQKCDKKCSTTCGGDGLCDRNSGNCSQRCKPGYIGKRCNAKCTYNKYGAGCKETCSEHCVRKVGKICDHVNGKCVQGCDPRYYGQKCDQECSTTCGGNGSCDRNSGNCSQRCKPGYIGKRCNDECTYNKYGAGCKETCSEHCVRKVGKICDHVNGKCVQGCDPRYYGQKCDQECSTTCGGNGSCDRNSGNCSQRCKPGYIGKRCNDECTSNKYGAGCRETCSEHCRKGGRLCHHVHGTCVHGCDPRYYGHKCDQGCRATCGGDGSCDRNSGNCSKGCKPGYTGRACHDECPVGKYGARCSEFCSKYCLNQRCDHVTGRCGSCTNGRYGFNCSKPCSPNCGGAGKNCNREHGTCSSDCNAGYWGRQCLNVCNKNCGGNDDACKRYSGVCYSCDPGYYKNFCKTSCSKNCGGKDKSCKFIGGECNSCRPGFYGNFCSQNCSRNCFRPDNSCDQQTGACDQGCLPGYKQTKCEQECDNGYYGNRCKKTCSEHCAGEKNTCNHINGTCTFGCDLGYYGLFCRKECKKTTWGQACTQTCNSTCQNNFCHHVNGFCGECMPGYQGGFCEQECNTTTYGLSCNKTCSINCLSSRCHHVTGTCHACPKNRTGHFCESMKNESGYILRISAYISSAILCCLVPLACYLGYRWYRQRSERTRKREHNDNEIDLNEIHERSGNANLPPPTASDGAKPKRSIFKRVHLPLSLSLRGAFGFDRVDEETDRAAVVASAFQANASECASTAISIEDLKNYISQHSTDSHFEEEFLSVPKTNGSPHTYGEMPGNVKKNRYKNIIPYDTTRVQLQAKAGKNHSDYINASYIKDCKGNRAFIASQGPTEAILNDFVRMLWEQNVDKVVMVTNLVEQGKKKCCMYWPVDGEELFGEISVSLFTTHVFAEYTIRHLHLSKNGEPSRDLTHFHFTAWPDHSVPDSPWGLVDLYQRVMAFPGNGPVLVHCSAGVGRTGTFIGLCNLLQEAEVTGKMDFRSILWKLRQDRMHTIQTLDQYIYLHRVAIVGYMVAGTTIEVKDMYCRLFSLESEKDGTKSTRNYKQEFEALVEVCNATTNKPTDSPVEEQRKNVYKNMEDINIISKDRLGNILSNPSYRPELIPEMPHEDTYINAVLVPNLIKDCRDILTQLPLPSTVTDFWRLVIQYNVGLVVAFDTDLKQADETIGDFLPSSEIEPFESERFIIETKATVERRLVTEFSLSVQQKVLPDMDSQTPQTKTVTLLLCKSTQMDPVSVLEILEQIQACRPMSRKRTVYMCRNGADKCGLVCIQSILLDRMKLDQCLTVPLVVGKIKTIRPQVIPTVDQYKSLYRILKLAHESQNEYANVGGGAGASST